MIPTYFKLLRVNHQLNLKLLAPSASIHNKARLNSQFWTSGMLQQVVKCILEALFTNPTVKWKWLKEFSIIYLSFLTLYQKLVKLSHVDIMYAAPGRQMHHERAYPKIHHWSGWLCTINRISNYLLYYQNHMTKLGKILTWRPAAAYLMSRIASWGVDLEIHHQSFDRLSHG